MNRPSPRTVRRLIAARLAGAVGAVPRLGMLPELFLPPLIEDAATVLWLDRGDLRRMRLLVTLYEVAVAMLIACGAGILVGAIVGGVAVPCAT